MSSNNNIFEDGENLQVAIGKALAERKALLCFVADESEVSMQWQVALLDDDFESKIRETTVVLRLQAGSEQAGFLNAVCPITSIPAVVLIYNAQVVANYQHGRVSFEEFEKQIKARYGSSSSSLSVEQKPDSSSAAQRPRLPGYLDLPPSEGRMRLPNNAYDYLRTLTQEYLDSGVSGKALLHIQLRLLDSLKLDDISRVATELRQLTISTSSSLPEETTNRLLNLPASSLQSNTRSTASSQTPQVGVQSQARNPLSAQSTYPDRTPASPAVLPRANPSNTIATQQSDYIAAQKAAEAERQRIKAQIETDKRARREADRQAREEGEAQRRRAELHNLRKANSTTSDPKATDVRIQVRLFDGGTIRNSFPAESTIATDIRPWIDAEVKRKAQGVAGQPYNLKLILTPLPNRSIEAGEEEQALADLEGIRGSATLVLVPVRTFVESYGDSGTTGSIVGGAVGAAQSVVGTGIALVGSAMGWLFGQGNQASGTASATSQNADVSRAPAVQTSRDNNRVRTLADQRRDEDSEAKRRGSQLYNGMGLNVQPRRDDEKQD